MTLNWFEVWFLQRTKSCKFSESPFNIATLNKICANIYIPNSRSRLVCNPCLNRMQCSKENKPLMDHDFCSPFANKNQFFRQYLRRHYIRQHDRMIAKKITFRVEYDSHRKKQQIQRHKSVWLMHQWFTSDV